jgi:hypothetical protein
MNRRPLTRSYAVANLEGMQLPITVPARHRMQHHGPNNTQPGDEDKPGAPKGPEHGQPGENSEPGKTKDTTVVKGTANHANKVALHEPTVVNCRKVVPSTRSPLPLRAKRPLHPGAPDMVKPKRTSAQVTAAAERRAVLQHQADELEQQKIDKLAEIELEEELAEEDEKRTAVRKQDHIGSLDNAEDVIMQSEDEGSKGTGLPEEIYELSLSEKDAQAVKGRKVIPKKSQVCFSFRCRRGSNY